MKQHLAGIAGILLGALALAIQLNAQKRHPVEPGRYDQLEVGWSDGKRIVVATNQVLSPLGRQVTFAGRPTDLALSPNGRWLAVLDRHAVLLIDVKDARIVSRAAHKGGSYAGIVFARDGKTIYASNLRGTIGVFTVTRAGRLEAAAPIPLPVPSWAARANQADGPSGPQDPRFEKAPPGSRSRNALPIGLALSPNGKSLWAVLNLRNALAEIDLATRRIKRQIPAGNAPYGVVLAGGRAYVSNWAGRHPGPDDLQAPAGSGTPVRVDRRAIAADGSVSVLDLAAGRQVREIVVGLHPSGLLATPDGRYICVANANSDTVSVLSTERGEVVETIDTRPAPGLLFGSSPNALALSADARTLYVANATNNAVALVHFEPGRSRLLGCLPTGWYPAGIVLDERRRALYVANVKGLGSRATDWKGRRKVKGKTVFGFNSHDYLGSVSLIPLPPRSRLAALSRRVLANNRSSEAINALAPPRAGVAPRPVPARHGEPSLFEHVVYIIKENRTYDQVLGDVKRGEGDPSLCLYGEEVTPNHHALVEQFILLDNFYCNGTLSADGHQWTSQAFVTDYIEKAYGGWPRSYPYDGGDAMAYAASGFLWDNVLDHGKTLRIYGEFVQATIRWKDPARRGRPGFLDCYRDFLADSGKIEIRARAAVKTLEPHICPSAIGFPGIVPDVHRAAQFIAELEEYERKGSLPSFLMVLLPNDHTAGTRAGMPTPEAAVADNDLALGRVVQALSHSRFWAKTCIFVVEDDPQNGFDHIDGRRTVAMVISPYTRRGAVDSTNYNQTSMVRTIELILGLPPMNQFDASASAMSSCFAARADLSPYDALPNRIPLDRVNPKVSRIDDPRRRRWALVSRDLPLDDIDEADEDTLNRILWFAARGRDDTYPAWAVLGN